MYPTGHLGLIEVTFLVDLPFTHVIVDAAAFAGATLTATEVAAAGVDAAGAGALGADEGAATGIGALWLNLILIVGDEKVKLAALNRIHPSRSLTVSVATSEVEPSVDVTLMVAWIGAVENPYMHRATSERIARS